MEDRVSLAQFAEQVLQRPLYPYQIEVGEHILDSILGNKGLILTVMMARQSGKNQLSAALESYLLCLYTEGSIVKAAPTWRPQIINSRIRLLSMLDNPTTRDRVWKSFSYRVGLAPSAEQRTAQSGPCVFLFSASPDASVVGATASLLLEIDEAQDVAIEKFNRDLRPMASTTNATTVLYGTAWSDETLLAMMRANNLELERQDGIRRHFEYDWHTLAAINPHYKRFVEAEIARLGEEHISIRTQYRLLPISGAGFLLNEMQRHLLSGGHDWCEEPDGDEVYVLGCDVGGEDRPAPGAELKPGGKRDSTIVTIGRVSSTELALPRVELVHHCWFTGMHHSEQYAALCELTQRWNVRRLVIDATGLGEGLASLLIDKFGEERVTAFKFSRPSKSKLTYHFLSMINSGLLKMYRADEAPAAIYNEAWRQLRLARYGVPGERLITMFCSECHDDFLMSIALCCEATREFAAPIQQAQIVRPRRLYADEGRF